VLLGGGYARFLETRPTAASSFVPGTNTEALVYGGGVDTRTIHRVFHIPIGFRAEVGISTPVRQTTISLPKVIDSITWFYGRSADQILK
jgi:hypothetical protein